MVSPEQLLINFIFDIDMRGKGGVPPELGNFIYKHIAESQDKYAVTHKSVAKQDVAPIKLTGSNMIPHNIELRIKSYGGKVTEVTVNFSDGCLPMIFFIYSPQVAQVMRELVVLLPVIKWLGDTHGKYGNEKPAQMSHRNPLLIHLFMADDKKRFPETTGTTISYEHCNAAVTWSCNASGGEILIYRKEEWGKTLIHELFHALCLDMTEHEEGGGSHETEINAELKRIFHLPGKPAFRETYCELWATILYCAAIAQDHIRKTNTVSVYNFRTVFREFVKIERHHAFIQVSKILRFWKVDWCDFLKHRMCKNVDVDRAKRDIPKEGTHVFCYFILRCVLLHDIAKTFGILKTTIKRGFNTKPLVSYIQNVAYGDDFEQEIQSHDRANQVILSRVHGSRMNESHRLSVESHMVGNFRMSALSGWMI